MLDIRQEILMVTFYGTGLRIRRNHSMLRWFSELPNFFLLRLLPQNLLRWRVMRQAFFSADYNISMKNQMKSWEKYFYANWIEKKNCFLSLSWILEHLMKTNLQWFCLHFLEYLKLYFPKHNFNSARSKTWMDCWNQSHNFNKRPN